MKIVIISGGFDPVHSGHIDYISEASKLGDKLIIALNSDKWLEKKKGKSFLPFEERKIILENIINVKEVIGFEDDSKGSAINAIRDIKDRFPDDEIIFANGGDRSKKNIPEMEVLGVKFEFSVGGDLKRNSSSWILKEWNYDSEERVWGKFSNLYTEKNLKVKELIVKSGEGMSFQRHFSRNEVWFISKGSCEVNYSSDEPETAKKITLNTHDTFKVNKLEWHQITNPFNEDCHIIEIQYGEKVVEEDIERLYYFKESQ